MIDHPELEPRPMTDAERQAISEQRELGNHLAHLAYQAELVAKKMFDAADFLGQSADHAERLASDGRSREIGQALLVDGQERRRLVELSRYLDDQVRSMDSQLWGMDLETRGSERLAQRPNRMP